MSYFVWLIVGIILLAVTIFVHKHSYERKHFGERGNKLPLPVWLLAILVIVSLIPVVNLMAFILGVLAYIASYNVYGGVLFYCELRWWKSLVGFLTREV